MSWAIHVNFAEKLTWVVKTSLSMVIARPLCSLMIALLFLIVVWAYYTWPGLMIAFGIAVPVFAAMMAIYSWGRLPGMDVHVLEPVLIDDMPKNRCRFAFLKRSYAVLRGVTAGSGFMTYYS